MDPDPGRGEKGVSGLPSFKGADQRLVEAQRIGAMPEDKLIKAFKEAAN
jgi:hypothetical protein